MGVHGRACNDLCNETVGIGEDSRVSESLNVASGANADPDVLINRPPKPGVAGSNPAGGAQNPGPLTRRSDE